MVAAKPNTKVILQFVTIFIVAAVMLCSFAYLAPVAAMFLNVAIMLASLGVSFRTKTLWNNIANSVMLAAVPSSIICVQLLGAG